MMKAKRSHEGHAARRQCLLGGCHPVGSPWALECPILNAEKRSQRARKAAAARWGGRSGAEQASTQHHRECSSRSARAETGVIHTIVQFDQDGTQVHT